MTVIHFGNSVLEVKTIRRRHRAASRCNQHQVIVVHPKQLLTKNAINENSLEIHQIVGAHENVIQKGNLVTGNTYTECSYRSEADSIMH